MHFDKSPRVEYKRNPLAEVICQLRFPRILRIDSEPPADFQEALGVGYPNVKEVASVQVPDEVVRALGMERVPAARTNYEFESSDGVWKVTLSGGFVALTCTAYENWKDFSAHLKRGVDALSTAYEIATFTRIGLRYKDVIQRSRLGLEGRRWSDLLRKELLGELVLDGLEASAAHAARELVLQLDHDDARVRLFHGFVTASGGNGEVCYVIDADFFRDQDTESGDAEDVLGRFNRHAGNLFRWCISRDLHVALEPVERPRTD